MVLLGRTSLRDVVRPLLRVRWSESPGYFERDEFSLADGTRAELFSCNHAAAEDRNWWTIKLRKMVESLQARGTGVAQ